MASWMAQLQVAEAMAEQLLATGLKELHLELLMAKTGLEKALRKNSSLLETSFGSSSFASSSPSEQRFEKLVAHDDPSGLWMHPPEEKTTITDVSLVVNPKFDQGRGLALMEVARAAMQRRGVRVQVLVSERPGHERALARAASCPVVAVLGGSGTARECINGILERPDRDSMCLALLGGGRSSSGLEVTLGIRSLESGLARLFGGLVRRMDVLKFQDHAASETTYGVTAVYGSFVAWLKGTSWTPFLSKGSSGKVQNYLSLSYRYGCEAKFVVPERDASAETRRRLAGGEEYMSIIFNSARHLSNSFMTAPMHLAPEAKLDDGRLHMTILPSMSLAKKIEFFTELSAGGTPDAMETLAVSSVTLVAMSRGRELSRQPRSVGLDSDICGGASCTISVVPRALRILA